MAPPRRYGKKLFKSLLPILLVLALAVAIALGLVIYGVTRPPRQAYLVTPKTFAQIGGPVLKVTDETWMNRDGTTARGWLLRGSQGAPAVILLHRYGADRSWLLNLGVKLNETTNFTILWPDLRGHGMDPPVKWSALGLSEGDDVLAAIDFLRTLKGDGNSKLLGDHFALYGVELGAYAALRAAQREPIVHTLVLDSVPRSPDDLLQEEVTTRIGLNNGLLQYLARLATRIYFMGHYENTSACDLASSLKDRHVLLLSGKDAGYLQESTSSLARCFQNAPTLETRTDLPLTGINLPSATGEQGEGYDRRIIDFFDRNLR